MDNINFYKKMLDNLNEGVYFVDKNKKITFWNAGAEKITGFSANEVLNSYCHDDILNHVNDNGKNLCEEGCPLQKTIQDSQPRETKVYLHHKYGNRVKVFVKTSPIYEDEELIGAVEIFNDDKDKVSIIENLEKYKSLALYDQLTNLPNRRYLKSYLETKMKMFRDLNIKFGVAFIDIDHFKEFNDIYGHDLGDKVLKVVSNTYASVLRSEDLAGRWGGEEFILVFSSIDLEGLKVVSEKIRMLVENSIIRSEEEELSVTISLGSTLVKEDDNIGSIIKRADKLMYKSKQNGRDQVTIG